MCAHCGQRLPARVPAYGARGANKSALALTLLLHLVLLLGFLLHKERDQKAAPPAGAAMVYLSPLAGKPKPKARQQAPKPARKTAPPKVERLPNTITLPRETTVSVTPGQVRVVNLDDRDPFLTQ